MPIPSITDAVSESAASQSSDDYVPYLPARCIPIDKIRRRRNIFSSISTQTSHTEESLKRISNLEFVKLIEQNKAERMKAKHSEAALAQLRSDMTDIHSAVKELNLARNKQLEEYRNEITELRSKLETSEEEQRVIKEKYEKIKSDSAALQAQFQADITELNEQLKKVIAENVQLQPLINKFMTENGDMQEKMKQMRQTLSDYERANAFMQDAQVEKYSFRQVEIVEDVNENVPETIFKGGETMEFQHWILPKVNFHACPSGLRDKTESAKMQSQKTIVDEDEWSDVERVIESVSPTKKDKDNESAMERDVDDSMDIESEIGALEKYLADDDSPLKETAQKETPKREYRIRLVEAAEWDEAQKQIDEFREMAETSHAERSRKRKLFMDELTRNDEQFKRMYAERKQAGERIAGIQLKSSLAKAGVSSQRIDEVTKVEKWGYKQSHSQKYKRRK